MKIRKLANKTSLQIYLHFDELPKYTELIKGKRIDIVLKTNLTNTEPTPFETDDRVVKFLTQESEEGAILSFFMRYEPQSVSITMEQNHVLIIDILLGNQFTMTYPELSAKLQGVSLIDQEKQDFTNPYITSPYAGNWRSFFTNYEPEVKTGAPFHYTNPPFPITEFLSDGFRSDVLPPAIFELSAEERWLDMVPIMVEEVNKTADPGLRNHQALVLGEILFRAGKFNDAFKQLFILQKQYPGESIGTAASYLLARLEAEQDEPFKADHQLGMLGDKIHQNFELSPFILLSQIETSLATKQFNQALELLQRDDIAFPPRLTEIKKLRQADYWYATGDVVKAYVGYTLFKEMSILNEHPYSLNGYCNALYHHKKFEESAQCFDTLTTMVSQEEHLSMISLKMAMAQLHFKPYKEMYVTFSSIENTYADTPAGQRAALKKNDIRYLSQPSFRKSSVTYYNLLAREATARDVAEEAAFKEAIVNYELGNTRQSLDQLMAFKRNFHRSKLKSSAQALIIEQLPGQIAEYLNDNNYVDAIVLAKQNRKLFVNNWVDIELLGLLAKAYHELGINNEARKLYLFLLNNSDRETQKQYYLPLLSILYSQGYLDLVEDYATQYNYNYSDSEEKDQITLLRLKSLLASNEHAKALNLVTDSPIEKQEFRETAAKLYFITDKFDQVIDNLSNYYEHNQLTSAEYIFMLAESYFRTVDYLKAASLFEKIQDDKQFFDHARYRLALIARESGDVEKSLKLLAEIVEKGNDPLWQKLARKDIEFHELAQNY
ncbi:MAG: tetratricopeptide repeat protein [Desulfocapsaceae bacterium]|nr:tetratricopeptide repeat protein [Desulfocapsaceae bacterium]